MIRYDALITLFSMKWSTEFVSSAIDFKFVDIKNFLMWHFPKFICTVRTNPQQTKMAIMTQNFFVRQELLIEIWWCHPSELNMVG